MTVSIYTRTHQIRFPDSKTQQRKAQEMLGADVPEPGKEDRPYIRIMTCKPGRKAIITCHCSEPIGRWLHWQGRGVLCPDLGSACHCGPQSGPRKWYAHIVGKDVADGKRGILQVPYCSWTRFRTKQEKLYVGCSYELYRVGDSPFSSCVLAVCGGSRRTDAQGMASEVAFDLVEMGYSRMANRPMVSSGNQPQERTEKDATEDVWRIG